MKSLLIVGMHRSGTSAVARIANMLGFNLGPRESMGEPSSDNPKGFWEQMPVRNLNDFLLQSAGATWDNPHDFSVDRISEKTRFDFFRLADRFVSRLRGDVPWAIKDPRLSLTMNAWRPLLQDPVVLLVYRHPLEVARSLEARNQLPREYGLALWEKYVTEALHNSSELPLLTINYGDVIASPVEAVRRLEGQLSEFFPGMLSAVKEAALLDFIDPGLNHQRSAGGTVESDGELNDRQRELVAALEQTGSSNRISGSPRMSDDSYRLLRAAADLRMTERVLAPALSFANAESTSVPAAEDGAGGWAESVEQAAGRFADFLPEAERLLSSVGQVGERVESFETRLASIEGRLRDSESLIDEQRRALAAVRDGLGSTSGGPAAQADAVVRSARRAFEAADEIQRLLTDTRDSWRWKVGNTLVRVVEAALLRGKPMLAVDAMESGLVRLKTMLSDLPGVIEPASGSAAGHLIEPEQVNVLDGLPKPGRFDVVIFPIIDWHFRIQRPQHIAREMARRGHRVFYLTVAPRGGAETPGFRLLEMPEHGVFICELQVTGNEKFDLYGGGICPEAVAEIRAALKTLWRSERIGGSVSIVQHPSWCSIVRSIPANFVVYDCMDHHAGFSTHTRDVGRHESALIDSSDLVVVTSEWLRDHHSQCDPEVIRNAAEIERFLPLADSVRERARKQPVVGYIGTIAEWFDLRLIVQSARKFSDWKFVLVGSTAGCDTSEAQRLPNIVFEGERPYSEVGEYLRSFDVCVIPFKLTDLIKATNPVKAYEYLAAGKPVVSVELPELKVMSGLIHLARDQDDWNEKLQIAMEESRDRKMVSKRSQWAREHSWAKRAEDFENAIAERLPTVSIIILAFNNLEFSRACIASVLKHTRYPNLEIVIVDNGSTDGSMEYFEEISEKHPLIEIVSNAENLGFAGGNNRGIEVATGEIVVLLNNDTYVAPGWLHALVSKMKGAAGLDLAGPVTNNIGNEAMVQIAYDSMESMAGAALEYCWQHADEVLPGDNLAFFCVAISRRVIDRVGLLDESFRGGFFEDDDYCRRALEAGFRLGIVEDSFVHHHLSASFDKLGKQRKQEIFEANKAVYEAKWGKWNPHSSRS